jgi:hypothetical protein
MKLSIKLKLLTAAAAALSWTMIGIGFLFPPVAIPFFVISFFFGLLTIFGAVDLARLPTDKLTVNDFPHHDNDSDDQATLNEPLLTAEPSRLLSYGEEADELSEPNELDYEEVYRLYN